MAAFWTWLLEYPLPGNPALEQGNSFDLSVRQSGQVWFWVAPDFGERVATLPAGAALFLTLRDVECSSFEAPDSGFHAETEEEQAACAKFWADHIVNVFCVINDVPVENMQDYRFSSPQFSFTAPTVAVRRYGRRGHSGYFLMLAPLLVAHHTIHYGGNFHFEPGELGDWQVDPLDFPKEIIIQLTVE